MAFPPPVPKKNAPTTSGNPLPIPLKGWSGVSHANWPVYSARIFLGEIIVCDPTHAKAIYNNGFFGHGALSSNGYDYELTSKKITRRQFERKNEWRKMAIEGNKCDPNFEATIPKRVVHVIDDEQNQLSVDDVTNKNQLTASTEGDENKFLHLSGKIAPDGGIDVESCKGMDDITPVTQETDYCSRPFALCYDPFPLDEPLVLMPEEAVFLCYTLGCLVVTDAHNKELDVDELWDAVLAMDEEVVYRYVVYHQLRSEGWVVRSGARYSADYMLYTGGPPYNHAQLLVRIEALDAGTCRAVSSRATAHVNLLNLLDRIASSVQKMFVLTAVLRPASLQSLHSVEECLQQLRVEHLPFQGRNLDSLENENEEAE
ncbi:tRNA-splicing endonuclease [Trinorchestia longiramus]|nr:tRNA-splicing endonuclease [Trinorchestia longiramus]